MVDLCQEGGVNKQVYASVLDIGGISSVLVPILSNSYQRLAEISNKINATVVSSCLKIEHIGLQEVREEVSSLQDEAAQASDRAGRSRTNSEL